MLGGWSFQTFFERKGVRCRHRVAYLDVLASIAYVTILTFTRYPDMEDPFNITSILSRDILTWMIRLT